MTHGERVVGLREQHKLNTRQALVDAALELFDERGYTAVTVDDICSAVGVSPRTFFRYFATKEHVLAEPIVTVLAMIRSSYTEQSRTTTPWTALRTAVLSAAETVEAVPDGFLRAGRIARTNPDALASSAAAMVDWERQVSDETAVRLGVDTASLYPSLLLGVAMLAFRTGLTRWTDRDGRESVRGLVEQALDAVAPGARALQRAATADHRSVLAANPRIG